VPLLEQKLFTLPEYLSASHFLNVLSWFMLFKLLNCDSSGLQLRVVMSTAISLQKPEVNPICFVWVNVLLVFFVFIYLYWCPTRFSYLMMFLSFSSTTTGITSGAGTANRNIPV